MANSRIDELIKQHLEIKQQLEALQQQDEVVKQEVKYLMNKENLKDYEDVNGNSITIRQQTRESLDKDKVRQLIGELNFKNVVKVTTFDVVKIMSKESRDKVKQFIG